MKLKRKYSGKGLGQVRRCPRARGVSRRRRRGLPGSRWGKFRVAGAGPKGGAPARRQRAPRQVRGSRRNRSPERGREGGLPAREAAASRARRRGAAHSRDRGARRRAGDSGAGVPALPAGEYPCSDLYLCPGEAAHVALISNLGFSVIGLENGGKIVLLIWRDSFVFIHRVGW